MRDNIRLHVVDAALGRWVLQIALQDGEHLLHLDARDRVVVVQVSLEIFGQGVGGVRRRVLADVTLLRALGVVAVVPGWSEDSC